MSSQPQRKDSAGGSARLQVDQSREQPGHQEVQVAQAKQGEHIRAEPT